METSLKTSETSDNNVKNYESLKKHDVNLKNNSSLYFQIGLILCLLATYGLFEMKFEKNIPEIFRGTPFEEPLVTFIRETEVEPDEPVKERHPEKKLAVLTDKAPVIAKNDASVPTVEIVMPQQVQPETPTINTPIAEAPKKEMPKEWNMNDVERVPVFPGCESAKNNEERMACMSEKLSKLIQKKFNTDLATELGLSGIQKIQVQFKIDDRGHVTDIKTRSPYSQLEKEAERVVSKIPVMTPGMQRNTPVSVVYYLPIAFQVH